MIWRLYCSIHRVIRYFGTTTLPPPFTPVRRGALAGGAAKEGLRGRLRQLEGRETYGEGEAVVELVNYGDSFEE